jgi:hypothetical protein
VARWITALLAALIAALALPALAAANTQSWSEPDETVTETFQGKELDVQSLSVSQGDGNTLFETEIQYPTQGSAPFDRVVVFADTDVDGAADRAVSFLGLSGPEYTVEVRPVSQSPQNCQRIDLSGSPIATVGPTPLPAAGPTGLRLLSGLFPTSALNGSVKYRVVAYGLNDSLSQATFDYLPNEANPLPSRQNPLQGDSDGCDSNGDGTYGDAGSRTASDGAYPADLSKGHLYDISGGSSGNPGGGGGSGGGSGAGGATSPPPPSPITKPIGTVPVGSPALEQSFEMPQVEPYLKRNLWRFVDRAEARRIIEKKIKAACNACPLPNIRFDETNRASNYDPFTGGNDARAALRKQGKPWSVMRQLPKAGTKIVVKNGDPSPTSIKLWVFDPDRERSLQQELAEAEKKRKKKEKESKKKVACSLVDLPKDDFRRLMLARDFFASKQAGKKGESATEILLANKCNWNPEFKELPDTHRYWVSDAKQNKSSRTIDITVQGPANPGLAIALRDDPAKAKTDELGLRKGDWVLGAGKGVKGSFTMSVTEIATGRFVSGVDVEVWFGDELADGRRGTARLVASGKKTDANGDLTVSLPFEKPGTITVFARHSGKNGVETKGYRYIDVKKTSGSTWTTTSERTLAASGGKWKQQGAAKYTALLPASLGSDTSASKPVFLANVAQGLVAAVAPGQLNFGAGNVVVFAHRGNNVFAVARPGMMLFSGGAPLTGVGPQVTAANVADVMKGIVEPLKRASDQGVGTVRTVFAPGSALKTLLDQQSTFLGGISSYQPPSLISDKGLGFVSNNNGNFVSTNTGNVISTGGGNVNASNSAGVISTGGGNVISTGGLNLLGSGAKVISTGGGNLIGQAGGNLIGQAGGNIISDNGGGLQMPQLGGAVISADGAS